MAISSMWTAASQPACRLQYSAPVTSTKGDAVAGRSPEGKVHLHGCPAVACSLEGRDRVLDRICAGQERTQVDPPVADELGSEGEFLMESEGSENREFLGDEEIDRETHLAAGDAKL